MADVEALIDKRVIPARSGRPDIGAAAPPLGCLCAPRPGAPISPGRAHCACTGAACDRSDSFVVSIRREGITRSTRSSPASPLQKSAPGRVISTRRSCRTWRKRRRGSDPEIFTAHQGRRQNPLRGAPEMQKHGWAENLYPTRCPPHPRPARTYERRCWKDREYRASSGASPVRSPFTSSPAGDAAHQTTALGSANQILFALSR